MKAFKGKPVYSYHVPEKSQYGRWYFIIWGLQAHKDIKAGR